MPKIDKILAAIAATFGVTAWIAIMSGIFLNEFEIIQWAGYIATVGLIFFGLFAIKIVWWLAGVIK